MHTFEEGDDILASEVNENFREVGGIRSFIAGENLAAGDAVYITSGKVKKHVPNNVASKVNASSHGLSGSGCVQFRVDATRTIFFGGTSSGNVDCKIGEINAGETDFAYGSSLTINYRTITANWNVCQLSATKYLVTYLDSATGNNMYAVVVDVGSGTTVTKGTEQGAPLFTTTNAPHALAAISATQAVIGYHNGNSRVLSISGTTVTANSVQAIGGNATGSVASIAMLSATQFAVFYTNSGTSAHYAKVGTISGTSISYGSEVTVHSGAGLQTGKSVITLSSTTVVFHYHTGNTRETALKVGTISGTSITLGAAETIANSSQHVVDKGDGLLRLNDTTLLFARRDITGTNSDYNTYLVLYNVDGTTLTILGSELTLITGNSAGDKGGWGISRLNTGKYIVNAFSVPRIVSLSYPSNFIGIASTSALEDASVDVVTRYRPVGGFSGLTENTIYKVGDDAQPTTESSLIAVNLGIALSATEMLVQ